MCSLLASTTNNAAGSLVRSAIPPSVSRPSSPTSPSTNGPRSRPSEPPRACRSSGPGPATLTGSGFYATTPPPLGPTSRIDAPSRDVRRSTPKPRQGGPGWAPRRRPIPGIGGATSVESAAVASPPFEPGPSRPSHCAPCRE